MGMKVILLQDIEDLGEEGDVCVVKGGFGRNFLLPQKMAVPFNTSTASILKGKQKLLLEKKKEKQKLAKSVQGRLEGVIFEITARASDTGKLFGSIHAVHIVEACLKEEIHINKKDVVLPHKHIREAGVYTITIQLYDQHHAQCVLKVLPSGESGIYTKIILPGDLDASEKTSLQQEDEVSTTSSSKIQTDAKDSSKSSVAQTKSIKKDSDDEPIAKQIENTSNKEKE